MIGPLLHLVHRGKGQDRIRAVTHMTMARPGLDHPPSPREMLFLSGGGADAKEMSLIWIMGRYPRLSRLGDPSAGERGHVVSLRVLVIGSGVEDMAVPILKAMATGILVVSQDAGAGAELVRDGINGFHYRARNPDSLALTLLTLDWLSQDFIQAVLARARSTFNAYSLGLHPGLALTRTGEPT